MSERAVLRILMFAYFYPPLGGAGVQRSLKFSKYLPELDIVPSVISADSGAYTQDGSLVAEVPEGIEVVRLPHTPALTRLMALAPRRKRARPVFPSVAPIQGDRAPPSGRWRDFALQAFGTLQYPDDKAAWGRLAEQAALRLMEQSPIDLVYSTSPPVSGHLAAMRVARHARVPWVADFRDLWTANPAYAAPSWRRVLDRSLEDRLLASANGIVTVSERLAAILKDRAGPMVPVVSIANGYDEADFTGILTPAKMSTSFRIVHAGTFYGHQSPESFLRGVEQLFERESTARDRLRIRFVGSVGSRFQPLLSAFEARYPSVLERTGYVDHREALAEMLGADALLLVIGGQAEAAAGVMTGKLFEYLRAGRPILLLGASNGEAAQLLRTVHAGAALDHHETERVAQLLSTWMEGGAPIPVPERAAAYERRALTRQLGAFLTTVHDRFHGRN